MKIESLKDLKKLIALCRSTGVEAIEVEGLKMNLGPTPMIVKQVKNNKVQENQVDNTITEDMKIPTDGLTEEQLLYYSAQGHTNEQ